MKQDLLLSFESMTDNTNSTPDPRPKATILIVEDDPAILEGLVNILELYLTDYDITILEATNGEEALAQLKHATPDLIISDIRMPRMDGYTFLEQVRLQPGLVHIPFIFLTAASSDHDIYRGRLSGAELYITKPISHNEDFVAEVNGQLQVGLLRRAAYLRRMQGLKGELLRKLQHEFRTPLTFVTSFHEILADSIQSTQNPRELIELLDGIQAGSQRLLKLVGDLRLILALRSGEAQRHLAAQAGLIENPGEMFAEVIRRHAAELDDKRIQLNVQLPNDWPPIWGHRDSLQSVCERLLDNAIKFTERKRKGDKRIEVWGDRDETHIRLHMRDSGIGFPPNKAKRIFDTFYQHGRGRLEQQGAGLGLAIVKEIAAWHGGAVMATGQENQGSHLTVTLPIDHRAPVNNATSQQAATRILIVEDDPLQSEALADLLRLTGGFEIETAADGLEALSRLTYQLPDLILSDVGMPGLDGYGLLERVRANDEWVDIPFIFLTGQNEGQAIHRGRRVGVDEYITKPFKADELFNIVQAVLKRVRARWASDAQSFEELRQNILASLNQDVLLSLTRVSGVTAQMVQGLEAANSANELSEALSDLSQSSRQLSRLVEDFTSLVEIQTDGTRSGYRLRASLIEEPGLMAWEAWELVRNSAEFPPLTPARPPLLGLPPIYGDTQLLVKAIQRLLRVLLSPTAQSPQAELTLAGQTGDQAIQLRLQLRGAALPPDFTTNIQSLLATDLAPEASAGSIQATHLSIARHAIDLHTGRLRFLAGPPDSIAFEIDLPIYNADEARKA